MKLYIASRFANYERVRRFAADARLAGHEVTHDWTTTDEFDAWGHPTSGDGSTLSIAVQAAHARADLNGAAAADVLVLLPVDNMGGAYIEVGYALANGTQVWIAGPGRFTVFWGLPDVTILPDEDAAREALGMTATRAAA